MARITSAGVVSRDLAAWRDRLEEIFRTALGSDLNLAPETPQGQLVGVLSVIFAELDENVVALANALSVPRAGGRHLDDLGSLLGIPRSAATYSEVDCDCGLALRAGGISWTAAAGEMRARTSAGDEFVNIDPVDVTADGIQSVAFRAVSSGPVAAAAGALDDISGSVDGWESVTNPGDAVQGRSGETDALYRARYPLLTDRGSASADAIRAAVRSVDGVTDVRIQENSGDAAQTFGSITLNPHSIYVIVSGGADRDVVNAIANAKAAGIGTAGSISRDYVSSLNIRETIRFSRVTNIPLTVTVTLTTTSAFPGDGLEEIVSRIRSWFAGTLDLGNGLFDQTGISIGESLDLNRLLTPINSVPGHTVSSVAVARKSGGQAVTSSSTIDPDERYVVEADADVTFSIS